MVNKLSLLFFAFIFSSTAVHAAVVATVDRSDIAINESFSLRYESDQEEKRTPDFSPITQDFDIVGQNRSSNISIINGKSSRQTIFNLSLMPKRIGTLTIPEIQFSNSTSASIIINVKQEVDRSGDKDFEFTVSTDKQQSYIQEQILITVKMARAVNAQQESISDLEFSHQDIIIEPLSEEYKQYEAMINGRRHIVYERQYAIFPQKAGKLTLAPLSYGAVVASPSQQRQRGFFSDPFFSRGTGKRIRERSQSITFTVKPKPDEFIGKHWLPANKVEVNTTFSDNTKDLQVGDSVTRTITIKADQQLATTLPKLAIDNLDNANTYPDQADTNQQTAKYGIYSQRIERTAIVPTQAGNITFPAMQLEWWNTRKQQKEVINIAAETLSVSPGKATSSATAQAPTVSKTQTGTHRSSSWFYVAIFALLGWAVTTLAWLYHAWLKPKYKQKKQRVSQADIITACKNNNARAASKALLAWAQQEWPDKNITSLGALSNIADNPALTAALNNLQNNLYGHSAEKWNKDLLLKAIKSLPQKRTGLSKNQHILFNID